jgi:hypothetical protein
MPTAFSLLGTFGRLDASLTSALTGLLSKTIKGLLGIFGGAIAGFVMALKIGISALTDFAARVTSIADQTGMSLERSLSITNRLAALGIGADKTASIFGSREMAPQLFNARASAVGGPRLDNPNFGADLATWFQAEAKQGLGGFLSARARLDAMFGGSASPEILRLANSNPRTLQREAAYGSKLQSALGVDSNVIKRVSEDFGLLQNRISLFSSTVIQRFTAEMLPSLSVAFGTVSTIFVDNAEGIASALKRAGTWMFLEMPKLAISGARTLLDFGRSISEVFFSIADAGVVLLRSLGNHEGALYNVLKFGANFIDFISNFGRDFAIGLEYIRVQIGNALASWQDWNPVAGAALKAAGFQFQHEDPMQAAKRVFDAQGPASNASGQLDAFLDKDKFNGYADKLQASIARGRSNRDSYLSTINRGIDGAEKTAMQLSLEYQKQMLQETRAIRAGTDKTVSAILDKNGQPIVLARDVVDGIGRYIAQDTFRMGKRR